ncbi:MAG: 2-phospho-L-lactate guanylyltransferase [Deltaproteobacteria bacterium]|nr:2-phospho-L-lactate guanylyltransferase [Deltaproteobacteria bacterium]
MILIPVKNLRNAKQRLAPVLDQSSRTELARAMLADVLQSVAEYPDAKVSLVTSDSYALELAAAYRFEVIRDDKNLGESDAIHMATEFSMAAGASYTLVIPADVPLLEADDLRAIDESAPATGSVVVPSRDRRGTNAILRRPAALFPLRFGNDSFVPHLGAAIASLTSAVVLSLPRLALDIDTAEDLEELVRAPGEKRAQHLARRLGFSGAANPGTFLSFGQAETRPAAAKNG